LTFRLESGASENPLPPPTEVDALKLPDSVPLTVVIPARNEEDGLPRVLEDLARQPLPAGTEVVVVNDGSTDRTEEIAQKAGARTISLTGVGYGAALKAGFRAAHGTWLAFLDADGTYPPATLIDLWKARDGEGRRMILANRFTQRSCMPMERRIGNRIFARLASFRVGQRIPDLCSGQRLFPAALLPEILDLPDGLDFSPAMTLRFMARGYELLWVDTAYHDRLGESKLSVVADGFRFLRTILHYS